MIHATKPELEQIIREAANGLIAQSQELSDLGEELWATRIFFRDIRHELHARIAELESDRSADLGVFKLCEISGGIGLLIGWLAGRFL